MSRKTISADGEKRTQKLTVSMTPRQMEELKLYCDATGKSANDYIVSLLDADLKKNQQLIKKMREFRTSIMTPETAARVDKRGRPLKNADMNVGDSNG